jgi:hypothetical protein
MKHVYKFVVLAVILAIFSGAAYGQKKILCIGAGTTPEENASDKDFKDSLASWGYTVEYMQDVNFLATAPTWSNYGGVFINETVGSGNVSVFSNSRDKYPVPCILLDGWVPNANRWGWNVEDADFVDGPGGADEVVAVIKDNKHYITQIFAVDQEIIWSTNTADVANMHLRSIKQSHVPFKGLAQVKTLLDNTDFYGMVAVEKTDSVANRVFWWGLNAFGMNGSDKTQHLMTPDLFKVLKRGAEWTYKNAQYVGISTSSAQSDLKAFPNPAKESVKLTFNAGKSSSATVTILNIAGQKLEVIQAKINQNEIRLNTSKLCAGAYIVHLDIGGNSLYTKIMLK